MKNIIIIFVVFVGILLTIFFIFNTYIYREKQDVDVPVPAETLEREVVGEVTAVDLTRVMFDGPALLDIKTETGESLSIAVPSMGFNLCSASQNIADVYDIVIGDQVSARGALDAEWRIVPCDDASHFLAVLGEYRDLEVGFSFKYPKGPNEYINKGDGFTFSEDSSFVSGVMLVDKKESATMEENVEPREGPPAIQIQVYTNLEKQQPAVWADAHPSETNINLALSESAETSVGGANAVQFTTDGLYVAEVYVVTSGDYVILIRGEYIDTNSDIYRTFTSIVDTFEFVPSVNQI